MGLAPLASADRRAVVGCIEHGPVKVEADQTVR